MELYKAENSKIGEIWPGSNLDAVPTNQIPIAVVRGRKTQPDPKAILGILKVSKKDSWRMEKVADQWGDYRGVPPVKVGFITISV